MSGLRPRPDGTETGGGLVALLRREAGDNLRSVGFVHDGEYEPAYVRDDVHTQYSDEEIASIVDALTAEADRVSRDEDRYELGRLGCVVRCFSRGLVLQFPREAGPNPVVSLDPGAGTRLHAFVAACRRHLRDSA